MSDTELETLMWDDFEAKRPGDIQKLKDAGVSLSTIRGMVKDNWMPTVQPETLEDMIRRIVREEMGK